MRGGGERWGAFVDLMNVCFVDASRSGYAHGNQPDASTVRCVHGPLCPGLGLGLGSRIIIRVKVTLYVDTSGWAWTHLFVDTAGRGHIPL